MQRRIVKQVRHIRGRQSYTIKELARMLGVHPRTVQVWKTLGLEPIDPADRPLLFMGDEIRRFVSNSLQTRKCPLQVDEFFCPRCRAARKPDPVSVRVKDTGRRMGVSDSSLLVQGRCSACGCSVNRFSTIKRLNSTWGPLLFTQVDRSLDSQVNPVANSVISRSV